MIKNLVQRLVTRIRSASRERERGKRFCLEVVSLHIPKTAGTSFRQTLRQAHGEGEVLRVDIPLGADRARVNEVSYDKAELPLGVRVVHGHFCPRDLYARFPETANVPVITWLRDPVERVISNYFYLEKRLREELDEEGKNLNILSKMQRSLLEYAGDEINRNRQSKFLVGLDLEDFAFVGILEHYDEDLAELSRKYGWATTEQVRVNVTGSRPAVSTEVRAEIARLNAADTSLYQQALHLRARRKSTPRVELISIHVPKTAGTSFHRTLREVYGPAVAAPFRRINLQQTLERYDTLEAALDGWTRALHGHLYYAEVADLHRTHGAKLVTWLRDPVERVISNYRFFKAGLEPPYRNLSNARKNAHRRGETLRQYAGREETRNVMSRFLAGAQLDDFFFVGLQEYYAEDLQRLGELLNWPPVSAHQLNVSSPPRKEEEIDGEIRAFIADNNRKDIALYEAARALRQKELHEKL